MSSKKNILTGLVISFMGVSKTALSSEVSVKETADIQCDDETREFVLTADNPLFLCPTESELSSNELFQCKKIVACMVEQGIMIDANTLVKFASCVIGGETTEQPTKTTRTI